MRAKVNLGLLILGIIAGLLVPVFYYWIGFKVWLLLLWFIGLGLVALSLGMGRNNLFKEFGQSDTYAIYFLLLLFIPIYFLYLYQVPYQMNTDEATIMLFQKMYQHNPDVFSNSSYFGFASFIFIATAWAQNFLGGIDLSHARMVHAGMAVVIVLLSFVLFRQFWKTWPAFMGAVVLGSNHSLLAISRMAMRDNSALLVEVLSLPFLFFGLRKKNLMLTFIGGCLAGLSFYVYQPGRILVFIWLGFLVALALFLRKKYSMLFLAKLAAVSILGFALVVLPVMVYGIKYPDPGAAKFSRERFLFYPEGQQLQKEWVNADTVKEAIIINIKNGLGTFNNRVHDLGYIYPNFKHGFVDPVSGVLLWIGVLSVLYRLIRKRFTEADLLNFFAFIGLWLLFAFIINKTPNYTRLFVTLPFFAYLVVSGIMWLSEGLTWLAQKIKLYEPEFFARAGKVLIVSVIVLCNLLIFGVFADKGLAAGDNVGGTARYIESKKYDPNYQFYLVADDKQRYYSWGDDWQWTAWMEVYTSGHQTAKVLKPANFVSLLPRQNNFTIFMNQNVWKANESRLKSRYPQMRITNITTDGNLLAIEIFGSKAGNTP